MNRASALDCSFLANPNADSTLYAAPSGARVFATGSLDFATGLDEWPVLGGGVVNQGLQRFAVNMLTDLGGAAPATLGQIFPETPAPPLAPVKVAPQPPQQITAPAAACAGSPSGTSCAWTARARIAFASPAACTVAGSLWAATC